MECLGKSRIEHFVRGELPPNMLPGLEEHLDSCFSCLEIAITMARLTGSSADELSLDDRIEASSGRLLRALARYVNPALPSLALPTDRKFGPYRVLETLGQGAMGVVYRAAHEATGQCVAIKTVIVPDAQALAALRQEAAFLARQRHPGIVGIIEDGVIGGSPWFAMELLEGQTLQDCCRGLRGRGRGWAGIASQGVGIEELDSILEIYIRLCSPLSFLHRSGIVHGDLSPNNVIVRADGQPVLIDFGLLSRASGSIGRETLEVGGSLRGTLPYTSPERIRGNIPDARADLYAFGCNLFQSLTGRPPFVESTIDQYVHAHLHTPPPTASSLAPAVPPQLDELIQALLAKRPCERLGDAEIVADLLARVLARSRPRRVQQRWTPYLFRPTMVGRRGVAHQIRLARAAAQDGSGALVLVSGESGIGKTFLASELARAAATEGYQVILGECSAVATSIDQERYLPARPLGAFAGLIQAALDRRDELQTLDVEARASSRALELLVRYLPRAAREPQPEALPSLPPEAERARVLQAMRQLLELMMTSGPLQLVLDDLQWADDLSLSVLSDLAAHFVQHKRLLILGFSRAEESTPRLEELSRLERVVSIHLGRLGRAAVSRLAAELLSGPTEEGLVGAVSAAAEGNPFFVAEYLREAAARGLLRYGARGWSIDDDAFSPVLGGPGSALPLPRSLLELLERRIDLLGGATQRAVEAGAVLGRTFSVSSLGTVCSAPVAEAELWVDDMVRGQLVDRLTDGGVRFVHDKLREAAYARIDPAVRRVLHGSAAQAISLEQAASGQRDRHGELAHHHRESGDIATAIECLEAAGEHAIEKSAGAEAARFFRAALTWSAARSTGERVVASRRAYWHRRTGDALQSIGDLAGSKRELLAAVELYGRPIPKQPGRMALAILGGLLTQSAHRAVPARWLPRKGAASPSRLDAAPAYDRLMQTCYYRGEYGPMFLANLTMLNLAERGPVAPSLATAYTNAAAVAGIVPLPGIAARYFALAEGVLARAYHPEVESHFRLLLANYQNGRGNWLVATAAADRALELTNELGYVRRWEDGAGVRCNLAWGRNFEESLTWCSAMQRSGSRRGDAQVIHWGQLRRAEIHAALGQAELLSVHLAEAEAGAPRQAPPEQIRALALRASVHAGEQRFREALELVLRAEQLLSETKAVHVYCLEGYAHLARVRLALWAAGLCSAADAARGRSALQAAARIFPIAVPRSCLHRGTWSWLSGDRKAARSIWRRGRRCAQALGIPYDEALLEWALAGCEGPGAAAEHRARAAASLARLGVSDAVLARDLAGVSSMER